MPALLLLLTAITIGFSFPALAQDTPALNSGDTAWMMVSSALVLLMTLPGLALFYGGLVKKENVLATLMQSLTACCVASILWIVAGYSLTFTGEGTWIGGWDRLMLKGLTLESLSGTIPESVFILYQMTFAIITPALIFGAVADRMEFKAMTIFTALWLMLVYVPVAHWVWGPGGFIGGTGLKDYPGLLGMGTMIDFAGGAVVHINAGVAGLVAALMLGKRRGFGTQAFLPHNLVLTVIGGALLWVGWFGFNAGSALAAGGRAGMAMLTTQAATAAAALVWVAAEWLWHGKPSVLGIVSGAVAGLVAITPASGFVDVSGALWIGAIASLACYWCAGTLKKKLGYDDSLDVFGIHGVGGLIGSILTGVFAVKSIGGTAGLLEGNSSQLWAQAIGSLVVVAYSAAMTLALLAGLKLFMRLRVEPETEYQGMDLALHGERVP